MSKPVCLVTAPVATRSGYGAHSRDIVHSLIDLDLYDVKIMPVRWGNTPQNALDENNLEDKKILDRFLPDPSLDKQPDLHIHIVVPNEFQTWGKYNIGITAGAEFTAVRPEWLEGLNRMDLNIVPSEFTKEWIVKTKFDKQEEGTKEKIGELLLEKPIEVLFEGYDESIYGSGYTDDDINMELNSIKENFCFLFTGHWLQGGLGNDRKDVGALIKIFYEAFGKKINKPALILKTCGSTPSVIDRHEVLGKIDQIKKQFPGQNLPPVYLLHGDLTDNQMNALYHHPKVKAMVMFTHGEGFGRPLLEFSTTGKPILVSNWSGHLDFLKKDAVTLIKGRLTDVPKDAFPENIYQEGAQWFTCYFDVVKKELVRCFKQYRKYSKKSKRQKVYAKNFTRQKMTEKLGMIIDKYVPEFPREVALNLPKLKKVDGSQDQPTKIKLPKLKKIDGGQTGAIIPPSNEQKSRTLSIDRELRKCYCCENSMEKHDVSNVWECKECKHIFRNYKGDEDLTKYYTESYRKNHPLHPEEKRDKYTDKVIDFMMDHEEDIDIRSILEIGAADGLLTKKLKDKFDIDSSNISVCELNDEHCDELVYEGFNVHRGNFMDTDFEDTYDMVVGIDVIEHIKDASSVPQKFLDMLNDHGKVLLQLPCLRTLLDPNEKNADGVERWDGHFHYFTEDSIRVLFENDFIVESIYKTSPGESARGREFIVLLTKKLKSVSDGK